MADSASSPFFSIIIPTRDRPDLFSHALQSVLEQSFTDREILVIVDGSSQENLAKYQELEALQPSVKFLQLMHQPNGHGQSYSMNFGVRNARGAYLCFLDDDDYWTDPSYLETVFSSLSETDIPVDVHYSNQKAYYSDHLPQTDLVWLEKLIPQVGDQRAHINDSHFVDAKFILRSNGFAHLNCSIFSKQFYSSIGGMDENIRYENDREVFIRSLDKAEHILYSTRYVSRHNIPDVSKKENMSTIASALDKKLYQIRVYDKGLSMCVKPEIRLHCRLGKTYELKHITSILANRNEFSEAAFYAREALLNGFNPRWLAFTLYLSFRALIPRKKSLADLSQIQK
jgi:glycosyltransferase involved in cell wall biosynthesis